MALPTDKQLAKREEVERLMKDLVLKYPHATILELFDHLRLTQPGLFMGLPELEA